MKNITVKHLINLLLDYPMDSKILLSRDSEGNDFDYVYSIGEGYFDDEEEELLGDDEIVPDDYEKVVVLWP